ncbi:hypothetical protein [Thermosphaera sp.]
MELHKLDKVFVQGVTYKLPNDRFYVIKKIGTDQASPVRLIIDGVETGAISSLVAPLYKTSSRLLPPLDLGDLFYVVPNNKQFYVDGPTGAKVRCMGLMGILAPNEIMPPSYVSRFMEQGRRYLMWIQGSKLYDSDYTWRNEEEISILLLTPKTNEQYVLNNICLVETGVANLADGSVGLRVYLEGRVLDILTSEPGKKGLDCKYMPRPPIYNGVDTPFSFSDWPITVSGDQTLELKLINVSGGNLTISAATDQYVDLVVEYWKRS